ncbi:uncharacterized protein LOC143362208 [Halictus rubicundus]|uniref:uncharacterized protein LOC143362208 n=1 Tax=Halictus rubicundus TaxID=77578 RepID=UPI004036C057
MLVNVLEKRNKKLKCFVFALPLQAIRRPLICAACYDSLDQASKGEPHSSGNQIFTLWIHETLSVILPSSVLAVITNLILTHDPDGFPKSKNIGAPLWANGYLKLEEAAMGSPISPIIADIYMEDLENRILKNAPLKPTQWFRYVDDTFVVWSHGRHTLDDFLHFINSLHPNIQFTMEIENEDKSLPFLDVLVTRKIDGSLGHRVYRKPTHTNRYMHASSHHHPA